MSLKLEFQFGPEFQTQMLAYMVKDSVFASRVIKYIPAERLYSDVYKYMYELIKMKLSKNELLSYVEVEDELKKVDRARRKTLQHFATKVFSTNVENVGFLQDKLTEYAQKNHYMEIFRESQTLYNSKKFDESFAKTMSGMSDLYSISFKDDAVIPIAEFENHRLMASMDAGASRVATNIDRLDELLRGGLEKGELGIILAEPKKGKCGISLINLVLADGSSMTLGEVIKRKEKFILSFNEETGRFEKDEVIDWIESGEKPVFDLETTSSRLRLTACHPLLTLSGWKPLKDLKPKDLVFVPRRLPHGVEESLSKERLTLLAYMLADGTMNKGWSWSKKEPAMIKDFETCHAKEFERKTFDLSSQRHRPSPEMKEWFEELGLLGKLSATKFIPAVVERQNGPLVAHFLNKIFTCDGSAEACGKVSYCSKSHRMISQIQSLLLRFKIASALKTKTVRGEAYYEIGMQGPNLAAFREHVGMSFDKGKKLSGLPETESSREYVRGFSSELWSLIWSECETSGLSKRALWEKVTGLVASDRQHHFRQGRVSLDLLEKINKVLGSGSLQRILDGEWIMTSIRSITPAGSEMTYDIEVKKNHNFIAENVLVHNSIGLTHMGAAAVMMGTGRVAHFVLEGTTKQAILRYQSRLSGIPYHRLEKDEITTDEQNLLDRISKRYMHRLDLVPFNQHWNYTVQNVESSLKELTNAGKKPDLVVIDYADLLKSSKTYDAHRHEQTEVYRDLKRLAVIGKYAIWTASQATRPKESADTVYLLRAKDIAESFEKVRIADLLVTLNQTPDEKALGILRLHIDIYRSNSADFSIKLLVDFERMIFFSKKYGHAGELDDHAWMRERRGKRGH